MGVEPALGAPSGQFVVDHPLRVVTARGFPAQLSPVGAREDERGAAAVHGVGQETTETEGGEVHGCRRRATLGPSEHAELGQVEQLHRRGDVLLGDHCGLAGFLFGERVVAGRVGVLGLVAPPTHPVE